MKRDDAEAVIEILLAADGGCEYCVADLLVLFCERFPEFKELAEKAFRERFGDDLKEFVEKRWKK